MASNTEFSRTLSLLRQERGVSQRTAAMDLGISQALLSHYENGIREPGLHFVVKACEYYHVSADFMLGRTLSRDGTMLSSEDLLAAENQSNVLRGSILATIQSKLLGGSISVLFELLGKLGDKGAINEAAAYLGTAVYQLYRRLYRHSGSNESYFALPAQDWELDAALVDMKCSEMRYARALGEMSEKDTAYPPMNESAVTEAFPGRCQSVTQVLHAADSRMSARTEK